VTIDALLMHPLSRSLYRCRVEVNRDGLSMWRVSGEAEIEPDARIVESEPIEIGWRTLRGFSADESYVTPAGRRLQVLEIDTEEGVLTVLVAALAPGPLAARGGLRWAPQEVGPGGRLSHRAHTRSGDRAPGGNGAPVA
jgi:hypothetical protein